MEPMQPSRLEKNANIKITSGTPAWMVWRRDVKEWI